MKLHLQFKTHYIQEWDLLNKFQAFVFDNNNGLQERSFKWILYNFEINAKKTSVIFGLHALNNI